MPPTAATMGTTAVRGLRSSPATISRLSSSPTTKKKIASSPSVAQVASVRSRCRAAGPTTVSETAVYDAGATLAQSRATTVPGEQQGTADALLAQGVEQVALGAGGEGIEETAGGRGHGDLRRLGALASG